MKITSHFQPIISLMHRRVVGYEALLRAIDSEGQTCTPLDAFAQAAALNQVEAFDRQCIATHLTSFSQLPTDNQWLFVNLRSETIKPGNQRAELLHRALKKHGLQQHQIVLEILEDSVQDPQQLQDFVHYYRKAGFLIAIDDFGTGQSNFDRIWQLEPHIVKLDRSMLLNARQNTKRQRWFSRCVALLRETGALILVEGVETQEDAALVLDSEADMVQGFYFARPTPTGACDEQQLVYGIQDLHKHALHQQLAYQHNQIRRQTQLQRYLQQAASNLIAGQAFQQATQSLLQHEAITRVYLLNTDGVQIVENLQAPREQSNLIYRPLSSSKGAIWARRNYFRRAIEEPGRIQISAPYLGMPDATLNVTLSVAIQVGNPSQLVVLCADLPASYIDHQ